MVVLSWLPSVHTQGQLNTVQLDSFQFEWFGQRQRKCIVYLTFLGGYLVETQVSHDVGMQV